MIDLVYVLGSGSQWKNNELRFSLRSVAKNLSNVRNVYIIGEDPGFLSENVIHIYHPDELNSRNADGNMALKILRACDEPDLSDDFLFMNDDFIINKPISAVNIPLMHKGDMKNRPPEFWITQLYRFRLRRTFDELKKRGFPTMQYDYHAPMIMNKLTFQRVMAQFDFKDDIGLTFRSLYGNTSLEGALSIPLVDQKMTIYQFYRFKEIQIRVEKATFVGYNDNGLNNSLKYWMFFYFREQSKYETSDIEDEKIFDIVKWNESGRLYENGVAIFRKYFKNQNFTTLFTQYSSQSLEKKLDFKLNQYLNEL